MTMEGAASSASPGDIGAGKTVANSPRQTTEASQKEAAENPFKGTKHKLKVDGREEEVEYDQLLENAQKGKAADRKFQEAAQLRKDMDAIMQGLSTGDEKTWNWLKSNVPAQQFKQIVNKYAYEFMEYDSLPADQKRQMELDEREKRLNDQDKKREDDAQRQVWQSEVAASGDQIKTLMDKFTERTGKQPTSAELYRMTETMLAHLGKFETLPDVDNLYDRARRELERDTFDYLETQDVNEVLKKMSPKVKSALKQAFLAEATAGQPKRYAPQTETGEPKVRKPKQVGIDDYFDRIEKRFKNKRG